MRSLRDCVRVRRNSTTIGEVALTDLGWVAVDDRHGIRRASIHASGDDAHAAVVPRASKTAAELDAETAEIVAKAWTPSDFGEAEQEPAP